MDESIFDEWLHSLRTAPIEIQLTGFDLTCWMEIG